MNHESQQGMSLLEILVALGIMGVVAVGAHRIILSHLNQVQSAKNISASSRLGGEVIDGARRLLSDVKDQKSGANTAGICRWADAKSGNPGVGTIYADLPALSLKDASGFTVRQWRAKFPGWKVLKGRHKECQQVSNYARCLVPRKSTLKNKEFEEARATDFVSQVTLKPVYVNPGKGYFEKVPLQEMKVTSEPIADIAFEIKVDLFYSRKDVRTKRTLESLFWAPAAGSCDKKSGRSKSPLRYSLSGLGASDPSGRTLYNIPKYKKAQQGPLDVGFLRTQAQAGKVSPNGQFISTNRDENIAVSCNENRYQCPNLPSSSRQYAKVDVKLRLNYNPFNKIANHATEMTFTPKFSFVKGRDDAIESTGAKTSFHLDGNNKHQRKLTVGGTHSLNILVGDDRDGASRTCRLICRKSNDYNTSGRSTYNRFVPVLNQDFHGSSRKLSARADEGVACTACYMKNCAQLGIGTFGPMVKQPYQPLDSNIPECWVNEDNNSKPYDRNHFDKQGSFAGEGCVAAKLERGDKLVLAPKSCSSSLPVMCFNFGSFALAQNVSMSSRSLFQSSFDQAHKGCFEMGREYVRRNGLDLKGSAIDWGKLQRHGQHYSFVNVASQGLFLAPQIAEDVESFRKWMETQSVSSSTWVWTNLRYKDGEIYAAAPPIGGDRGKYEVGIFHDDTGRLTAMTANSGLGSLSLSPNADSDLLLFHNLRFKGAVRVSGSQSNAFRVLCMKNRDVVVSKKSTKDVSEAEAICQDLGGKFQAPTTPLRWVKALLEVMPSEPGFPSPQMNNYDDLSAMNPVWVSGKHKGAAASLDP